jgi:ribulose-bisphosphate carboxylase large chain
VKPKTGLSPKQHALVAYNSWIGGLDIVKDDENLTNQGFNPFNERVREVLRLREKAERLTGKRKMYMANITAPTTEEMIKRAEYVKSLGGESVMVDIITTGWTALQSLRGANERLGLVLHAHRCGHSAFTRYERHGIAMLVVAKLCRLIGLDQLHIGTIIGKMEGGKREVLDIEHEMEHSVMEENDIHRVLKQSWYSIKPLMPVASGGIQPLMIPELVRNFGSDIILQFGGGVHAHPNGTRAGAAAALQALEASLKGIPLKKYAVGHEELSLAIKKWG